MGSSFLLVYLAKERNHKSHLAEQSFFPIFYNEMNNNLQLLGKKSDFVCHSPEVEQRERASTLYYRLLILSYYLFYLVRGVYYALAFI